MTEESVWIVTRESVDEVPMDGAKGWRQDLTQKATSVFKSYSVSPQKIQEEWARTIRFIGQLIHQAEEQADKEFDMQLDEVTLTVEIDGKGRVGLMGTCNGEANGKGAVTLKFKRSNV